MGDPFGRLPRDVRGRRHAAAPVAHKTPKGTLLVIQRATGDGDGALLDANDLCRIGLFSLGSNLILFSPLVLLLAAFEKVWCATRRTGLDYAEHNGTSRSDRSGSLKP